MEQYMVQVQAAEGMKSAYLNIRDYAKKRKESLVFLANTTEPEYPDFAARLRERAVAMEEVMDAIDNIMSVL